MERHVAGQRVEVDRPVGAPHVEQGGKGGSEPQALGGGVEVERLYPQPVPSEDHPATVPFSHREGEHAVEMLDTPRSPFPVCLEHHLGVGVGEEAVAERGELVTQRRIVVDAAVEDDGEPEIGVDHRLGSRR